MQRKLAILATLAVPTFLADASAQIVKYAVSPAGYEFQTGNSNNTFPLGRVSASYQQIHDAADMGALNSHAAMVISGMHFRPAASYSITARAFDVQVTLSTTSVTSAAMSTTFSANLGTNTTVVLPYTNFNLPAGAGTGGDPNAPLWKFPFTTIYPYNAASGNLVWDWRQKNSTSTTSAFFDFVSNVPTVPITKSVGDGCTATGQTSAATSDLTPSGSNIVASLSNGRASSPAFAAIGLSRAYAPLWCGTLWVNPIIVAAGATDSTGSWTLATFPSSVLNFPSYTEVFLQYAFADAGLAGGVGLSNYAVGASPPNGSTYISRLWNVSTANGSETATTGSKAKNGLVTMFTIL
ncbi:MAG: hypothetical protein KDC87_12280 [Planctomycetes bacterium]|nr:hypothetical protein [Planctomycetota bacterium]MCB9871692.1 hypothetical protein [Planctomycetota bacterium]